MLKRLYVHNYKALVNFELRFEGHALLMGANGAGKSSVLEVLSPLRRVIVDGDRIAECLPSATVTRWGDHKVQRFEIDLEVGDDAFHYEMLAMDSLVTNETLRAGADVLFSGAGDQGELYRDDGAPGTAVLRDWERSTIPIIRAGLVHARLLRFREALRRCLVIRPNPIAMTGRAETEARAPAPDLSNFASWCRHLLQETPDAMQRAIEAAREVLPGFRSLSIRNVKDQDVRMLISKWDPGAASNSRDAVEFGFGELSDGQRVILGLVSVLAWAEQAPSTILLDEPENYVALAEVQPLLKTLLDSNGVQVIVASHHPEFLNEMAVESGIRFSRTANGPVRVDKFSMPAGSRLTASQFIANRLDDGNG